MGLDTVEIIVEVEKHFNIEIPNDVAATLYTVSKITDYIASRTLPEPDEKVKYEIQKIVTEIVADIAGLPISKVGLNDSFTHDLGID